MARSERKRASAAEDLFSHAATAPKAVPATGKRPAQDRAGPGPDQGRTKDRQATNRGPAEPTEAGYTAADIEVLEGLEPVRRRPGMYVGGTDERALHHLAAEIIDNAMDEAVAGHANRIEVTLSSNGTLTVSDNGRGIPVDPHPKFRNRSALEVILTTLHSGGKFSGKVYETSGGLHGVGLSVVNALAEHLEIEVARNRRLYVQTYRRGAPVTKLQDRGPVHNRRGTRISFQPDPEIFGERASFRPARLYRMARSKAYLFRGVEIRWSCAPELLHGQTDVPETETLHFARGLEDFLSTALADKETVIPAPFAGRVELGQGKGAVEWALTWCADGEPFLNSYCNTVPTPEGGTHEQGLRAALTKGLRAYGELVGNRKAKDIAPEDVFGDMAGVLSLFIPNPEFQGQTKERLATADAARVVETAMRDHFDHFLTGAPDMAKALLDWVLDRAEERQRRKQEKEVGRKSPTRKLRLPGKLADCSRSGKDGTELFLVEGDSAGGSAKQARDRASQAVLPLRGKILNVASAAAGKLQQNQELSDLVLALGCGAGSRYREGELRYEKVVIMTDADVDGAHIASLLMTFFLRELPKLVEEGYLYLALPPLYRLSAGGKTVYARDDAHRDTLLKSEFKANSKVEISRFKGLGEMPPAQLRDTTMARGKRTLIRVRSTDTAEGLVERLMGRKPELRFAFIQENAAFVTDLDV
jgi:topoisomerase-4 subunit B